MLKTLVIREIQGAIIEGGTSTSTRFLGDTQSSEIPIPILDNYKHVSAEKVFQENWVDIALLGFYCLLFFLCAFVSFLRFDVR